MMRQTTLRRISGGYGVDSSGNRLPFIGNLSAKEGDTVWTDGRVIYGNEHIREETFLPTVEAEGIPVRAVRDGSGFTGIIRANGKRKAASVVDDDFIVNSGGSFYHGTDADDRFESVIDAEIARDEDGNEIGVYTATYYTRDTSTLFPRRIEIKLNDELVETVYLDDYREIETDKGICECLQFHLNPDGTWEMFGYERVKWQTQFSTGRTWSVEETPNTVNDTYPDGLGYQSWGDYVQYKIYELTNDAYFADDIEHSFFELIYSKQANKLDGSYSVDGVTAQNSILDTDTEAGQRMLERLKAFKQIAPDEDAALVLNHDTRNSLVGTDGAHSAFWECVRDFYLHEFHKNKVCPECGGSLSYDKEAYPDFVDAETGQINPVTCGRCDHEEPLELYFNGYGLTFGFSKHDMSTITTDEHPIIGNRTHEYFQSFKIDSKGNKQKLKEASRLHDAQLRGERQWSISYPDGNAPSGGFFVCSTTGYILATARKNAGLAHQSTYEYWYWSDAGIRKWWRETWLQYYQPEFSSSLTSTWQWELNDGYVATVNDFQVLRIEDKDGNIICNELPAQRKPEIASMPYLTIPRNSTAGGNMRYYLDGTTAAAYDSGQNGYFFYPYNQSLSVQKLKAGYLVAFHGYKLYHVAPDLTVTEIGDNTRNMRLNFLKKMSLAIGR